MRGTLVQIWDLIEVYTPSTSHREAALPLSIWYNVPLGTKQSSESSASQRPFSFRKHQRLPLTANKRDEEERRKDSRLNRTRFMQAVNAATLSCPCGKLRKCLLIAPISDAFRQSSSSCRNGIQFPKYQNLGVNGLSIPIAGPCSEQFVFPN